RLAGCRSAQLATPVCCVLWLLPPPPRSTPFPYTTLFRSPRPPPLTTGCSRRSPNAPPQPPTVARRSRPRSTPTARCRRRRNRTRSEEHTSELQSPCNLVCRLLLEKKNNADQQPSRFPKLS